MSFINYTIQSSFNKKRATPSLKDFYPMDSKMYLRSVIDYLNKARNAGKINDDQFKLVLTNVCANFIENMISEAIDKKISSNLSSELSKMSFKSSN